MASNVITDAGMDARARVAAESAGITPTDVKTFELDPPAFAPKAKARLGVADAVASAQAPPRICVVTGRRDDQRAPTGRAFAAAAKGMDEMGGRVAPFVVAVMREDLDGSMKMVRQVFSK